MPEANPETYSKDFFVSYHLRLGHKGLAHTPYNSSSPPNSPKGALWDPRSCPDFIPHEMAYVVDRSDLAQKLRGKWLFWDFLKDDRWEIILEESGDAHCLDYALVDPYFKFTWRTDGIEKLILENTNSTDADSVLRLFSSALGIRFGLVTYKRPYEAPQDYLLLWPDGEHSPLALRRAQLKSQRPRLPNCQKLKRDDYVETYSLSPEYFVDLLPKVRNFRMVMMVHIRGVSERRAKSRIKRVELMDPQQIESEAEKFERIHLSRPEPPIANSWVIADRLLGVYPHLKWPSGFRPACLFRGLRSWRPGFQSRFILIDPKGADSIQAFPSELLRLALDESQQSNIPGWIIWDICNVIGYERNPVSVLEKCLLDEQLKLIIGYGQILSHMAFLTAKDHCVSLDGIWPLPESLAIAGNILPIVAFASVPGCPAEFLPEDTKGLKEIAGNEFAYVEYHSCYRAATFCSKMPSDWEITNVNRERYWYRAGRRLWAESKTVREIPKRFTKYSPSA